MTTAMIVALLLSVVRLSTCGLIGSMGGLFSELAGVMNLCCQGVMCFGAFFGVLGAYYSGSAWVGLLCAVVVGGLAGLFNSLCTVEFGGNQNLFGIGLNTFAAGLTAYIMRAIFGSSRSESVPSLVSTPILEKIPVVGESLAKLSPITYIGILVVIVVSFVVYRTPIGVRLRAVGNQPSSVETAGVNVWRLRTLFVTLCGMLVGMAGASLSLGQMSMYTDSMVAGKGMLAFVSVKMGQYKPSRIVLIAFVFGLCDTIQMQLQMSSSINFPPELLQTLPYVAALVIMFFSRSAANAPTAVGTPYVKRKYGTLGEE